MKLEVRCRECNGAWLVEESSFGGELMCPNCLTRIAVRSARGEAEPAAPRTRTERAFRPAPAAAPARSAAAPPVATAAATAPVTAPGEEQIVCPRCKLHFFPRPRAANEPVQRRRKVLVVEDLEYFRQIASNALSPAYEVKTAGGAAEAQVILAEGDVDLIVLDLTLDGEDEGTSFLRALYPKPCPIVIFTAQDESEMYGDTWDELRELGADDLVIKGMNVGESLVRKVGNLLGSPMDDEESIDGGL